MKRSFAVGIVIFAMLLAPATSLSTASDWEDDDSWSYKWVYDYSDHKDEIEQMIKNSSESLSMDITIDELEGGYVAMFTVKYMGMDQGYHKFDYEGGYYTETTIDMSMDMYESDMSGKFNMNIVLDRLDSEFSGSLWVEEYEYGGTYSSSTAYGVVKQTMETNGEMNMNVSTDMEMEGSDYSFEGSMNYTMDMDWDMNLDVDYSPPLPWIPPSTGETSNLPSKEVMGNYTGNIIGSIDMDMEGTGDFSGMSEVSNIDENIEKSLADTEYDISGNMEKTGEENKISKPSPIMGLFNLGGTGLSSQVDINNDYSSSSTLLSSSVGQQTVAKYDSDEEFYSSYYMSWFGNASPSGSSSTGISTLPEGTNSIESESTTEEEVSSFMEDKEGFYEEHIGDSNSGLGLLWFLIPAVVIASVLGIGLYIRKKRKQKTLQRGPPVYQSGPRQTREKSPTQEGYQEESGLQGGPGQREQHHAQGSQSRKSEQLGAWDQQQAVSQEGRKGNSPQRSPEKKWQPDKEEKTRY